MTLVAFGLRVWHLGDQSFWLDEGFSAFAASQPGVLSLLTFIMGQDNHPPLHYLILQTWIPFAGTSEFSLRFVSVVAGTLSVPLIARLGTRIFDRRIGFVAAALLVISPFHIWYSQEARMYALVCLLAIASMLLYLRWRSKSSLGIAVAYVLVSTLMLLSHYYGFFVLVFENVALLAFPHFQPTPSPGGPTAARSQVSLRQWLVMQGAIAALYSPWLFAVAQQFQRAPHDYQLPVELLDILRNLNVTFSVGEVPVPMLYLDRIAPGITVSTEVASWGFLFVLLLGIGWQFLEKSGQNQINRTLNGTVFCILYLLTAPIVGYIITVALSTNIRAGLKIYYIVVLPAYLLLLARSLASLMRSNRILGLAACAFLFVASIAALAAQSSSINKEDFRSMASYVMERESQGEVLLLHPGYLYFAFGQYYKGALSWQGTELGDEESTASFLSQATAGRDGAWLVLSREDLTDPNRIVKRWLDGKGLLLDEEWFTGGRVLYYLLEPRPNYRVPNIPSTLDTVFGGKIRLIGYSLPPEAVSGSLMNVKLYWQCLAAVGDDYRVVIYLEDRTGHIWAQTDHIPLIPSYGTSHWVSGEYLTDRQYFPIPLGTPPGTYDVKARVYSPASNADLKPDGRNDDEVPLAQLTLLKAGQTETDHYLRSLPATAKYDLNDLTLWQWHISRSEVQTGERLDLDLLWRARQRPRAQYDVVFQIVNEANVVVQESRLPIGGGRYPTDRWSAGELVRDYQPLSLSNSLQSGKYRLRARLTGPTDDQAGALVDLGTIDVRAPERTFTLPEPQNRYEIDLGGKILFLGYDVSARKLAPGDKLLLSTYWKAHQDMNQSYKVFVHLLGSGNAVVAQQDAEPVKGSRPTTGWIAGEIVKDEHELTVPKDAPPGDYRVEIGFYGAKSGERLPVLDSGPQASENAILLGESFTVERGR
ncbi:MAG: glycosyltransferase family 39 protein [Chloroflexi bacterium]|nr:glycosyltransferase family 39 protein [Chloroflexota bacterium]